MVSLLAGVGLHEPARATPARPTIPPPPFPQPPAPVNERALDAVAFAPAAVGEDALVYGVNFISSAEQPADSQQYTNALSTGATWNRWPFYWHAIETAPGVFDWSNHDPIVAADIAHNLSLNAVLMGLPAFYYSGSQAVPNSLWEPVFSDGSDAPGPDKQINPNNKWAVYVSTAVNRYRPDGVLAQQEGWPAGVGVTHWEMWNEPDLTIFWDGTKEEYARLLKVGYLAAKQADPQAQVLSGAMANNFEDGFYTYYNDLLTIYDADPLAPANNYFHDIMATHSYYYAWQSWLHVFRADNALTARSLDKPIWLNESGVPAWNDYPGPVWDPGSWFRATLTEQADYTIQSAFFAIFAGADAIFHFQLYDGCGNQPQGTDFPPHHGELCTPEGMLISDPSKPCAGDAFGLFSNPTDAACFTQHPLPETGRLNLAAFQVLTTYVTDVEPLWRLRPDDTQEWVALYQPASNQRLLALWARLGDDETATVEAIGASALLIAPDGVVTPLTPMNGSYTLSLPAATNQNADFASSDLYPIGGRPFILVETDLQPPTATELVVTQLGDEALVSWSAEDGLGSGVASYDVAVAVDGGPFQPWLTGVTSLSAAYPVQADQLYSFQLQAQDRGGNRSDPLVTPFTPLPDPLEGVKAVSVSLAQPGDSLTYTITLQSGNTPYPGINLSDELPAQVSFIPGSLSASSGVASYANGVITWELGLAIGETAQLTYRVEIDPNLPSEPLQLLNTAGVEDGAGGSLQLSASVWLDPERTFLPVAAHLTQP